MNYIAAIATATVAFFLIEGLTEGLQAKQDVGSELRKVAGKVVD